jgi:hypothetical protein
VKKACLIIGLVIALCGLGTAQTPENSPGTQTCPAVSITAPSEVTAPGELMIFTAIVENGRLYNVSYKWSVSSGTIENGQNTPVIQLRTDKTQGQEVTAVVEVDGLPEGCLKMVSKTADVAGCGMPATLDDYEVPPFPDEMARLANVARELKENPGTVALFLIYITKKETYSLLNTRITDIVSFFAERRNISKERLKFVFAERESYSTRIYLVPAGTSVDVYASETESLEALRPKPIPRR